MKNLKRACLAALCAVPVLVGVKASAHHAFGAEFDPNRPLILRGPVVKIEWTNPHAWFHIEHTNDDGTKTVWMVEAGTPNTLLRRGIHRNSVPIGTEVVVDGYQSKGSVYAGQRPQHDVCQRPDDVHGIQRHGRTTGRRGSDGRLDGGGTEEAGGGQESRLG